ncbi:PREDICTED: chemokine-like receptor 1 [Crocodylus porosus]|uniref:Chemerin-like receptor 1 n=1 Tax=Crocodylus porosus TaxID=8502 RepID=A0A7M4FAX8_CROPO|nr:PREDICTED: chemokine-like receptor 1 [Crocodylus porosus]XP_019394365.1 PREDICTED: chemokine-like receptor 1 [Crocodylus porosus]XP_019394366.1 PREDICTED: chemokine-like receptor 1 [Crocodylus porosus]
MEVYNYSEDDYDYGNVSDIDYSSYSFESSSSHNTVEIIRILSVVIYSVTCLLGIVGNGLVIAIIIFKMKKSVNAIWFLNLAAADFLFSVFLPLNIAYTAMNYNWIFGTAMCKLNSYLLNLNMYTSVFLLTTISIDRYLLVFFPIWSQNHRTAKLACLVCFVTWTIGFMMSSPSLIFRDIEHDGQNVVCFSNFSLSSNKSYHSLGVMRHKMVTVTKFLTGFIIPITIITLCYIRIVCKLKTSRLSKSKKPFKIIVTIIVTFFLCWSPYHILHFLEMHPHEIPYSVLEVGIPITTALATFNSCMNPVLYVFMGQDFKKFKISVFSRLVNAISEDTAHSSLVHRSFSKTVSMTEKETILL